MAIFWSFSRNSVVSSTSSSENAILNYFDRVDSTDRSF